MELSPLAKYRIFLTACAVGSLGLAHLAWEKANQAGSYSNVPVASGDLSCLHKASGGIAFSGDKNSSDFFGVENDCQTDWEGFAASSNWTSTDITQHF